MNGCVGNVDSASLLESRANIPPPAIEGGSKETQENEDNAVRLCSSLLDQGKIFSALRQRALIQKKHPDAFKTHWMLMDSVYKQASSVHMLVNEMENGNKWDILKNDDIVTVFHDNTKQFGESQNCLMFDGIVKTSLFHLLFLMNEVPLYPKWMPFVSDSNYVTPRDSRMVADVWWQIESPFPFLLQSRDACVTVKMYDCLDEEKAAVYVLMQDMEVAGVPKGCKPCTERMFVKQIGFRLQPIGAQSVRVTGLGEVDVHLRYMPSFLINWIASHVCAKGLRLWSEKAAELQQSMDPKFEQYLENNKQFYVWLRKRILSATLHLQNCNGRNRVSCQ